MKMALDQSQLACVQTGVGVDGFQRRHGFDR